jgi:hypothetical protein
MTRQQFTLSLEPQLDCKLLILWSVHQLATHGRKMFAASPTTSAWLVKTAIATRDKATTLSDDRLHSLLHSLFPFKTHRQLRN